jgi:hypothetical protein
MQSFRHKYCANVPELVAGTCTISNTSTAVMQNWNWVQRGAWDMEATLVLTLRFCMDQDTSGLILKDSTLQENLVRKIITCEVPWYGLGKAR